MKKALSLALALALCMGLFSGCGTETGSNSTSQPAQSSGETVKTVTWASTSDITGLDPRNGNSTITASILASLYSTLVKTDPQGQIVCDAAESYEQVDDTTWHFTLRQDVYFTNGTQMTADDVAYTINSLRDSEKHYALSGDFSFMQVEVLGDFEFNIITDYAFPSLPLRLNYIKIVPSAYVEEVGDEGFAAAPIGSGPFKFVSWELGGDVVLEAFEDYWGGAPAVKRVIFRTIPEALNRTIGLETGEVDLAYDLGITDLESLADNASVTTLTSPSTTVWYVGMNVQKAPFDNEKVRQAVAYALDPQGYIDLVFSGEATPANYTMLPPSVDGYVSDCSDYSCNVEKAKELLAEAGYPDGFSTTLWCSDTQVMRDSAVVIQEQLRQVGINAEVKTLESGQFQSETGNGAHDMFIMSKTSIDPDSMLRSMYHTEALGPSGNRCFWTTPEVDALIDEASTTTDTEHAMELYAEIQSKVAEAAPLVPMAVEHLNAGMQSNVKGFGLYPGKSHYINGTYFE